MATRVAMAFAYAGSGFQSYSRQPDRSSVEGSLLEALNAVDAFPSPAAGRFRSGSRTDRGASAAMNVCAFDTDLRVSSLPGRLPTPDGLWPLSAIKVPGDFDPRRALWRRYRYLLADPDLSTDRLRRAMRCFVGEHDFSAFSRREPHRDPVRRVLSVGVRRRAGLLECSVTGRNFLWQQVRRMVGAARAVASGRIRLKAITDALVRPAGAPNTGCLPAEGLILERVQYGFRLPPTLPTVAKRLRPAAVRRAVASRALRMAAQSSHS